MRPGPDWGCDCSDLINSCATGEAENKHRPNRCRKVGREKQFHSNIIDVKLIEKVWLQFKISGEITFRFTGRSRFASSFPIFGTLLTLQTSRQLSRISRLIVFSSHVLPSDIVALLYTLPAPSLVWLDGSPERCRRCSLTTTHANRRNTS